VLCPAPRRRTLSPAHMSFSPGPGAALVHLHPLVQIRGPLPQCLQCKKVSWLCQQLDDANSVAVTSHAGIIYSTASEERKGLCADTSACLPSAAVASLTLKEERTISLVSSLHPAPPEVLAGGGFLELCLTWLELWQADPAGRCPTS